MPPDNASLILIIFFTHHVCIDVPRSSRIIYTKLGGMPRSSLISYTKRRGHQLVTVSHYCTSRRRIRIRPESRTQCPLPIVLLVADYFSSSSVQPDVSNVLALLVRPARD